MCGILQVAHDRYHTSTAPHGKSTVLRDTLMCILLCHRHTRLRQGNNGVSGRGDGKQQSWSTVQYYAEMCQPNLSGVCVRQLAAACAPHRADVAVRHCCV